ncbi:MAG: M23 family metallopeptidase [Clostridia bacterium]|nr:M23 family metallopeptidase [Clostridia bacterium]
MKKKIIKIIFSSSIGIVFIGLIIIVPILMLLDFFGANVTDGYVENNEQYADMYLEVVKKNILAGNGYVSLDRILYFYLENDRLTFEQIYTDNLDDELKQVKPISEVCTLNRYKIYSVCDSEEIETSGQINEIQNKPFSLPMDIDKMSITSFFMQERIVYGTYNIHEAWDFAAPSETPLYSVCDGKVDTVYFPYSENIIDKDGGAGNYIVINCELDDITYKVLYGHLYPNSSSLKKDDIVTSGQQIATVGTTGYSTGNHLHFQVTKDGKYIDGLSLIDFSTIPSNPIYKPNLPDFGLNNGYEIPFN